MISLMSLQSQAHIKCHAQINVCLKKYDFEGEWCTQKQK